jgi:hypothetical protein
VRFGVTEYFAGREDFEMFVKFTEIEAQRVWRTF